MVHDDRRDLLRMVAATLQDSAREYSRDGMTGISDARALHMALDVVDRVLVAEPQLIRRIVDAPWLTTARPAGSLDGAA